MGLPKASGLIAARVDRSRGLDSKDFDLGLLLFAAFSTIGAYKALPRAWDPGGFNVDCYAATAMARHYLLRPGIDLRVHDLYTQGFVHPLLYVPVLGILRSVGIPPQAQDNLAIAFVYAVSLGCITVLSYICCRAYLNRPASIATAIVGVSGLLPRWDSDAVSPNGEILGNVLLLGFWALLIYRDQMKVWLAWVLTVGTLVFHLKYQLIPQLIIFTALSGIGKRESVRVLAWLAVTCLGVDLVAYRLAGSGILARAHSLINEYISLNIDPGVSQGGKSTSKHLSGLTQMVNYSPQIMVAWLLWLGALFPTGKLRSQLTRDLFASVAMTVATLIAIILPGKYIAHYAILFIPTSIFVMTMGLRNSCLARQ